MHASVCIRRMTRKLSSHTEKPVMDSIAFISNRWIARTAIDPASHILVFLYGRQKREEAAWEGGGGRSGLGLSQIIFTGTPRHNLVYKVSAPGSDPEKNAIHP